MPSYPYSENLIVEFVKAAYQGVFHVGDFENPTLTTYAVYFRKHNEQIFGIDNCVGVIQGSRPEWKAFVYKYPMEDVWSADVFEEFNETFETRMKAAEFLLMYSKF